MRTYGFILTVAASLFFVGAPAVAADSCASNDQCARDNYCDKAEGDCDGKGQCAERPLGCPEIWDPVCGCDGVTYSNKCEAAAAGINIDYAGECSITSLCKSNTDCPRDNYCDKADGDCDGVGQCSERPADCPETFAPAPVCGCDGKTYSDECEAAAAGINVAYAGECSVTSPCTENAQCHDGSYCAKAEGDCDGKGQCAEKPLGCYAIWDPVCGCDGVTYSNKCEAAAAGINVDYAGECSVTSPCTENAQCRDDSYCAKAEGDCDGRGECREKPAACPAVWAPVCGCDGITYSNECDAAAAGVNVDYAGECSITPRCTENAQCREDSYCAKAEGNCDGRGECREKPAGCPKIWAPVCGCDDVTYSNECEAAAAGTNVNYAGECLPPGPTIVMLDPNVASNDVHTGRSGLRRLRILWSEAVIFNSNDITIVDEDRMPVRFSFAGSNTAIMTITFRSRLIYDRYTITIRDSAISSATGYAVDGDKNRGTGGHAVIVVEHRMRTDSDNNNRINFRDVALFADTWLAEHD